MYRSWFIIEIMTVDVLIIETHVQFSHQYEAELICQQRSLWWAGLMDFNPVNAKCDSPWPCATVFDWLTTTFSLRTKCHTAYSQFLFISLVRRANMYIFSVAFLFYTDCSGSTCIPNGYLYLSPKVGLRVLFAPINPGRSYSYGTVDSIEFYMCSSGELRQKTPIKNIGGMTPKCWGYLPPSHLRPIIFVEMVYISGLLLSFSTNIHYLTR